MSEQEIINELRLTLEFLERRALNLSDDLPTALVDEFQERADGLRPVVKQLQDNQHMGPL